MKKLLLSVLAVLSVVSVNAFQKDDYLYTHTAKFKVTSDNLVTNGDFSDAVYFTGWTDQNGAEVSALSWQYTPAAGPNGEAALMSLSGEEGNVLARSFELNAGTYSISYWIKGETGGTTSTAVGGTNYAAFYVNNDASLSTVVRQVSDQESFSTEWAQVTDTVVIASGEYLVMYFDRMATGTMVTGFEINEVTQVYDTRILERRINFVKEMLAKPEYFPNMYDDMVGILSAVEATIKGEGEPLFNIDNIAETTDFLTNEFEPVVKEFMAQNSADMIAAWGIKRWVDSGKVQKGNGVGGWSGSGGRWFHNGNGVADEDDAIVNYIEGFDIPDATQYISKEGLKPGSPFMLSMDVMGYWFVAKASSGKSVINYNSNPSGVSIYVNGDTLDCGVFDERNYTTYTVFGTVGEDGKLTAGMNFVLPETERGVARGGRVFIANPILLMMGTSQAEQDLIVLVQNIATQQNALKDRIDSAKVVIGKTAEYPWGMEVVAASIEPQETFLNETYAKYVDAAGNNVGTTLDDAAMPDSILKAVRAMNSVFSNLYALNQPNKDIVEAIAYHRGVIVDALYANASASSKAAYESSIADAEALYKTLGTLDSIAGAAEAVKYKDAIALMETKELAFKESCASYAAPAPKAVKNADMRNGGTGKPGKNSELKDWDSVFDTANGWKSGEKWNYADLTGYGIDGCAVQYWRGYTASPQGQTSQQITLTDAGVYEFEAYTYGNNENSKGRGYYTPVTDETSGLTVDTLFDKSGLKIFFGLSGIEDSIRVHSQYSEDGYRPSKKTVTYIKAADGDETFAFGFHATPENIGGSGCNYFGFGPVRLLYGGATDAYLKDLEADVTETVAKAQAMVDANKDKEAYTWLTTKLERYIKDAQEARLPWMGVAVDAANQAKVVTAKRNAIINMNLTMDRLTAVITGIEGVEAETVLDANAKGVYSITGVKLGNELKGLQKGLYIINGKKYIVK